jgi:hypothetical protein
MTTVLQIAVLCFAGWLSGCKLQSDCTPHNRKMHTLWWEYWQPTCKALYIGLRVETHGVPPTHANYWLLGNCISKTTGSEDLCQQDYHTHQRWQETEDTGQALQEIPFQQLTDFTPEPTLGFNSWFLFWPLFLGKLMLCFWNFTSNTAKSGHDVNKGKASVWAPYLTITVWNIRALGSKTAIKNAVNWYRCRSDLGTPPICTPPPNGANH